MHNVIGKSNFSIEKFHNFPAIGQEAHPPLSGAWQKYERAFLLSQSFSQCTVDGDICEFGVLKGRTLSQIAHHFTLQTVYGFDSFEGLPEAWHLTSDRVFPKGQMNLGGNLPSVPSNAVLVKGWYDESLPKWLESNQNKISFIHIDCDLYSSTLTVLNLLNSQIVPGTVIHFDDFYCWGEPEIFTKWEDGEYKALKEWTEINDREFEPLHRNNYFQCAIRITK